MRYLGRMGFRAREIDYGVVEVDTHAGLTEAHLAGYLRIWERVNGRATAELELLAAG